MIDKNAGRLRRAKQARHKIRELAATRLAVHRTNTHIYAQVCSPDGKVLASASTVEKEVRSKVAKGGNKAAATARSAWGRERRARCRWRCKSRWRKRGAR